MNPSLPIVPFQLHSIQLGSYGCSLASINSLGLTCKVLSVGAIKRAVVIVGIKNFATAIKNNIRFDLGILLLPWTTKHFFRGKFLVLLLLSASLFSMSVQLGFLWHMAWVATVAAILAQTLLLYNGDLLCWSCVFVHAAAMPCSFVQLIYAQFQLVRFLPGLRHIF